ncbi:hypothetical protein LTS08_008388 [Lithohypha guttulata]|nr:hypothetical protein LTS08_008388 [Lithohypha guttulata]
MSGHILGFSNTQSTLHGAGLKIAQGLGLQRLGSEVDEVITNDRDLTPARREKIVRREVGRRVWGQLCNQDWFSIPFSEMYTIQRSHFSTLRPQHIDDHTLLPIPAHEPSSTSFARCLNDIAAIMPQTLDAITNASTLYTKYEQVLHYDAKMRALGSEGTPSFLLATEPIRAEWPHWIPWARRSLKLCLAHKTIMIHRSFLGKSLTDVTFDHTRRTCMEASRTIVREASVQDDYNGPRLWIDQAFMVAAGITLSLDTFHRKPKAPEISENRKYVEEAINMLSKFDHSMIAVRGVRLLTSLLAEQARLCAERSIDSYKKRTRDDETNVDPQTPGSTFNFIQGGADGGSFTNALKRQKFDVPKFLENFVGQSRQNPGFEMGHGVDTVVPASLNDDGDMVLGNGKLGNVLMQAPPVQDRLPPLSSVTSPMNTIDGATDTSGLPVEYDYEAFEQIFPPHAEDHTTSNNIIEGDAGAVSEKIDNSDQQIADGTSHTSSGILSGFIAEVKQSAMPTSEVPPSVNKVLNQLFVGSGAPVGLTSPSTMSTLLPLPTQKETPATSRMRKHFLPAFMKLRQPSIPGLWTAWDPVEGPQKDAESGDWPQFQPNLIESVSQKDNISQIGEPKCFHKAQSVSHRQQHDKNRASITNKTQNIGSGKDLGISDLFAANDEGDNEPYDPAPKSSPLERNSARSLVKNNARLSPSLHIDGASTQRR